MTSSRKRIPTSAAFVRPSSISTLSLDFPRVLQWLIAFIGSLVSEGKRPFYPRWLRPTSWRCTSPSPSQAAFDLAVVVVVVVKGPTHMHTHRHTDTRDVCSLLAIRQYENTHNIIKYQTNPHTAAWLVVLY